eukprot:5089794-Lingulodinium_polyedra.AAC.1
MERLKTPQGGGAEWIPKTGGIGGPRNSDDRDVQDCKPMLASAGSAADTSTSEFLVDSQQVDASALSAWRRARKSGRRE